MVSVLIGVVSHPLSRYRDSQGASGLGAQLAERLGADGLECEVIVRTENEFDASGAALTAPVIRASLRENLRFQREWHRFLRAGESRGAVRAGREWLASAYWRGWTEATLCQPWRADLDPSSRGARTIRRLLNIELSHQRLMEAAVRAGTDWCLILEDDAVAEDVEDAALGLGSLMRDAPAAVRYVNVSRSHSTKELGIDHLLSPADDPWEGTVTRQVLSARLPVTNTVCAILYRTSFLRELLEVWGELPVEPVIPIDWKLNRALMLLHGRGSLPAGSARNVEPAPIVQMSMAASPGSGP